MTKRNRITNAVYSFFFPFFNQKCWYPVEISVETNTALFTVIISQQN